MRHRTMMFVALLLLALAGCGQPTTVDEAKVQLCQDLSTFRDTVRTLISADQDTTVEEFQANREAVAESYAAVQESAASVQEAQLDDLEAAYTNLDQAIQAIPTNATMLEAVDSLRDEAAALDSAWQDLLAEVQCAQ